MRLRPHKHPALLLPLAIYKDLFPYRRLREPALAKAMFGNLSINPITELHRGALSYCVDCVIEHFEALRLDAVNAILQKLVVRIAIADEVEMPIQVDNVIGVDVLVNNALLFAAHGGIIEGDLLPVQNRLFNGVDTRTIGKVVRSRRQIQVDRGPFDALLEMLRLIWRQ